MRRTNADTTTPHFYICNPLRFLDEAAVHSGRTRNVAHVGRARRGRGDHLDLYRESIDFLFRSLLRTYGLLRLTHPQN
jgi:hypothetical protein